MKTPDWIWYDYGAELVNTFMQARRRFSLDRVPKSATIRVTADAKYRLFVNGSPVCRWPACGFQKSWPIDTVDIAPFRGRWRISRSPC